MLSRTPTGVLLSLSLFVPSIWAQFTNVSTSAYPTNGTSYSSYPTSYPSQGGTGYQLHDTNATSLSPTAYSTSGTLQSQTGGPTSAGSPAYPPYGNSYAYPPYPANGTSYNQTTYPTGVSSSAYPTNATSTQTSTPTPETVTDNVQPVCYKNGAYYGNWDIYGRDYQVSQINAQHLTHLLYAFAELSPNGTVYASDPYADLEKLNAGDILDSTGPNAYGNVKQLYILKKQNRNLKTLLSIGGSSYSDAFSAAVSTATRRARFALTAVTLMKDWGFDGIDIDWEYPSNDTDATNFVFLLQAVRDTLDDYAQLYANGHHFHLTAATPAGPDHYNVLPLSDMSEYLDAFHLMGFDYAGSWSNLSGHQANLYPSISNNLSTPFNTDQAVNDYIYAGVPANMIVLGMPAYGRSFEKTSGLGQPFDGVGNGSYEAGVWDYKVLPRTGATEYYDVEAGASYSYDESSQELISYDSAQSVHDKSEYVMGMGMGGCWIWEISSDRTGEESLVTTAATTLETLCQDLNYLDYPDSKYVNIADGMVDNPPKRKRRVRS